MSLLELQHLPLYWQPPEDMIISRKDILAVTPVSGVLPHLTDPKRRHGLQDPFVSGCLCGRTAKTPASLSASLSASQPASQPASHRAG